MRVNATQLPDVDADKDSITFAYENVLKASSPGVSIWHSGPG